MSQDPPFEERRHDDRLAEWRMTKIEEQQDTMIQGFAELEKSISRQFAALRKELFENPVFVTLELFKMEMDSFLANNRRLENELQQTTVRLMARDDELARAQREAQLNSISSRRFTVTTVLGAVGVILAFVAAIYFRG